MALTVRPARADDKPALMDIARRVWDGHDYLPVFFDRWVREGGFWVGTDRGRVIGCGKATRLGPGEWWLEGLRVDPDLQGHGLGTRLSLAILNRTLAHAPRSLRLSTAEANRESIRIITRMGFVPLFATRQYRGRPGRTGADRRPGRAVPVSAPEAGALLARHPETWLKCGLLSHTWKFKELNPRRLRQLERRDQLLGVRERGRLAGLLVARPHLYNPRNLDIGFVSGTASALAGFRGLIARRLAETGGDSLSATASSPEMRAALGRLGLSPERGFGRVLVFEHFGGSAPAGRVRRGKRQAGW